MQTETFHALAPFMVAAASYDSTSFFFVSNHRYTWLRQQVSIVIGSGG